MVAQTIQFRYVNKRKLLQLLKRIFPTGNYEMEVMPLWAGITKSSEADDNTGERQLCRANYYAVYTTQAE